MERAKHARDFALLFMFLGAEDIPETVKLPVDW
jgi:hypothetical protein